MPSSVRAGNLLKDMEPSKDVSYEAARTVLLLLAVVHNFVLCRPILSSAGKLAGWIEPKKFNAGRLKRPPLLETCVMH